MRNLKKYLVSVVSILVLISFSSNHVKAQPGVSASFSVFYDNLSPYGNWYNDPHYGYVWAPSVGAGFRPYYSGGYWVMTDYGNTWVSSYPWGWAPFHYGRWVYDGYYGWVWVPDNVWGPAWVCWRGGGDYYGWAPLAPGISLSVSFGTGYYVPDDYWVFVPQRYVLYPDFQRYYAGPRTSTTIINQTTIINNTANRNGATYIAGPRAQEIQRASGSPVPVRQVQAAGQPRTTSVSGDAVQMYRPQVTRSGGAAPSKVMAAQRPVTSKPQPVSTNGGKPERLSASSQSQQSGTAGGQSGARQQPIAQPQKSPQQQAQPKQQSKPDHQPKQNNERPANNSKAVPATQPQQAQPQRQGTSQQHKHEQPASRPSQPQQQPQREQQPRPEQVPPQQQRPQQPQPQNQPRQQQHEPHQQGPPKEQQMQRQEMPRPEPQPEREQSPPKEGRGPK